MTDIKYQFSRRQIGALQCGVVHPTDDRHISSVAVFCHGFGAGGDDLVGLASEILQVAPSDQACMLVFPAAPLSLDDQGMPGGRAWWLLSVQRLLSALEDGRYEQVRAEEPSGIDSAREQLVETIQIVLAENQLDESRLLLGGFSQGAMLSVDTALRGLERPPAKLCLYSGCLICEPRWKPLASRLKETEIFQSHGRMDPILPLQTGLWLTELLQEAGCELECFEFSGVHTIPMEAIERTALMLTKLSQEPA